MHLLGMLLAACMAVHGSKMAPPGMPLHFDANIEITSHLVDRSKDYPPWLRRLKVRYDFDKKVARADILAGYDKGKTYIRRYDTKKEYMVKYGEYKKCERAYLGEDMPLPHVPSDLTLQGTSTIDGVDCRLWVSEDSDANVHISIYERSSDRVPIRLIQASRFDGAWTPLITYDMLDVTVRPQDLSVFEIPGGYSHSSCTRSVSGFPYIHIFDHYVRF
ncbi:hypothetical protein SDRG_02692 [Saprolegnia diclina VS20]|uniref:Uncharacterized protein n=1 Tax=Saprolegnia diclina (strain VS20) TaxID=1156394 RepID=T0R167_SAPDV|nr:hypothetical protein SDRG_02692 [Saprolegnia diclina VS20]EQC40035.1 hypothetical protein SDRG_02692 [Saprolegnia diclina VS20]|eukprot:XP_008606509.1 hypothetical protein SDRG_02692 [Saprolegnia diclina VS20]